MSSSLEIEAAAVCSHSKCTFTREEHKLKRAMRCCCMQMSSVFTAVLMILSLAVLTMVFEFLPKAILAAMILVSVRRLIDYRELIYLWKVRCKCVALHLRAEDNVCVRVCVRVRACACAQICH